MQYARSLLAWVISHGGLAAAGRSLSASLSWTAQAAAGHAGVPRTAVAQERQQQQRPHRPPRATLDAVTDAVRRLPMEVHASREEVEGMSVHQLKERLRSLGVGTGSCLEKQDLVGRLMGRCGGGSSAQSCGICCEDYSGGDLLRVLGCGHRMHVECVDQWLLRSATDYSRQPACPLCNALLITSSPPSRTVPIPLSRSNSSADGEQQRRPVTAHHPPAMHRPPKSRQPYPVRVAVSLVVPSPRASGSSSSSSSRSQNKARSTKPASAQSTKLASAAAQQHGRFICAGTGLSIRTREGAGEAQQDVGQLGIATRTAFLKL
ncbi:MAG: hypothetical protein WDW36_006719 [Sanguina aurantia]